MAKMVKQEPKYPVNAKVQNANGLTQKERLSMEKKSLNGTANNFIECNHVIQNKIIQQCIKGFHLTAEKLIFSKIFEKKNFKKISKKFSKFSKNEY